MTPALKNFLIKGHQQVIDHYSSATSSLEMRYSISHFHQSQHPASQEGGSVDTAISR